MKTGLDECVVAAALKIHRTLGHGRHLASYRNALSAELERRRLKVVANVPLHGKGTGKDSEFDRGNYLELVVEDRLILELKTLDLLSPIHDEQVATYLRLAEPKDALLINFGERCLRYGIRRFRKWRGRVHVDPWITTEQPVGRESAGMVRQRARPYAKTT